MTNLSYSPAPTTNSETMHPNFHDFFWQKIKLYHTLFESENERQKIDPVPIPLPRASRNFPNVKTRNDFFFS